MCLVLLTNVTDSAMSTRTGKAHLGRLAELAFDGSNAASEGFAPNEISHSSKVLARSDRSLHEGIVMFSLW
jgi:hypothetical protein